MISVCFGSLMLQTQICLLTPEDLLCTFYFQCYSKHRLDTYVYACRHKCRHRFIICIKHSILKVTASMRILCKDFDILLSMLQKALQRSCVRSCAKILRKILCNKNILCKIFDVPISMLHKTDSK